MFEVIPGILEKEWSEIGRKINLVNGFAKAIHIDIIDGKFAENTTFIDPTPFAKYTLPSSGQAILFEVHLMVDNPIQYLRPFAEAGFKRFLGHVERMPDQEEFVAQGQLLGEVGLAIDGPTDLSAVKVPYEDLDTMLIMSIKAGQAGQSFVPEYLEKVKILKRVQDDPSAGHSTVSSDRIGSGLAIEIDGGINDKTIIQAKNAGATRFVANSFIFNSKDPQVQYQLLEQQLL